MRSSRRGLEGLSIGVGRGFSVASLRALFLRARKLRWRRRRRVRRRGPAEVSFEVCGGRRGAYHVLCETLRQAWLMSLFDEIAQSEGIVVGVAACEALVSHVEEREVAALLDSLRNSLPLLLRGINTSWIVRTGVEENDAVLGHALDVRNHAIEIEANGLSIVVAVLLDFETGIFEHCCVVCPARHWNVDSLRVWVEAFEKCGADAESASSGDGLSDGNPVFFQWDRVWAVGEAQSSFGEAWNTRDAGILLVHVRLDYLLLGLFNGWEDIRLALVISIRANTEIDLLWMAVGFESFCDSENGIGRALLDIGPGGSCSDSRSTELLRPELTDDCS